MKPVLLISMPKPIAEGSGDYSIDGPKILCSLIEQAIKSLTSIKEGLSFKRKYKYRINNQRGISRWWFVVSGEESLLQQLQEEWPVIHQQVNLKGKWSLEPLLCYESNVASEPLNHDVMNPVTPGSQSLTSDSHEDRLSPGELESVSSHPKTYYNNVTASYSFLNILYFNARSILPKIDELATLADTRNPDLIYCGILVGQGYCGFRSCTPRLCITLT